MARLLENSRKIGLFGGTFDPAHLGHVHLADAARQQLGLDQIRFLPCRISPHKLNERPASGEDRLAMLRIATAGLPWAVVDDFEILRDGPSFSYQTAEAMARAFPGCRLFWIMGADQWNVLDSWAHPERMAECVEFAVFARGEAPMKREGYLMHAMAGSHPASATAIREAIARGETGHPWLKPELACWISERGLYLRDQ